jgi:hypothetical protein
MNDFANTTKCSVEEQRTETFLELLDAMGHVLREINVQVAMISDAVYRGESLVEKESDTVDEPFTAQPIVAIMRGQRDTAKYLLEEIVKIREALW